MGAEDSERPGPTLSGLKLLVGSFLECVSHSYMIQKADHTHTFKFGKHTSFLPRVPKAEGCTFYGLNGMPLPCFLLHSPFIQHSYRSIVLLSINRPGQTTPSPAAFLGPTPARFLSHDERANCPLTLSLTIKKVIDYIITNFT